MWLKSPFQYKFLVIISSWFSMMLQILIYHFVRNVSCTPTSISYCPKMLTPISSLYFWKFILQFPRTPYPSVSLPFHLLSVWVDSQCAYAHDLLKLLLSIFLYLPHHIFVSIILYTFFGSHLLVPNIYTWSTKLCVLLILKRCDHYFVGYSYIKDKKFVEAKADALKCIVLTKPETNKKLLQRSISISFSYFFRKKNNPKSFQLNIRLFHFLISMISSVKTN